MKKLRLYPIKSNECVFMDPKLSTIVALYMDDIQITNSSKDGIKRIKKDLNAKFHITDMGPCTYYLGMIVKRDRQAGIIRLG